MKALIFDVDGTLAETEDVHRRAFNAAFRARGVPWNWDVDMVSSGKKTRTESPPPGTSPSPIFLQGCLIQRGEI